MIVAASDEWTEVSDAALRVAVAAAAQWACMHMPHKSDMSAAWKDGAFTNDHWKLFWAKVAKDMDKVKPTNKEGCFQRYDCLLNMRVARFTSKRS